MDDSRLRELFREAREADEGSAPVFPVIPRRRMIYRRWPEVLTASLVAAFALVVTLLWPKAAERLPSEPTTVADVPRFEEWTAPTDFLLETPGRELLSSTPVIGAAAPEFFDVESAKPKGTRT